LNDHGAKLNNSIQMAEILISVDIEASGPIPGEYSMLALGACVVGAPEQSFYVELKPLHGGFQEEALAVAGFDLAQLERDGTPPERAMADFEAWIQAVTPSGAVPVCVAYPISFDWMFVAYYFHRFLGRNPFGIAGLDVKSFYAGMMGSPYISSGKTDMDPRFSDDRPLTHHAREDAIAQAALFQRLLTYRHSLSGDLR
jgi:DNA polymerase III epsilon subunit-like protein